MVLNNSIFPTYGIRNIAVFYILTVCRANMFIAGNWIFFWLKFMPYSILGVVEAIAFGIGFITEIPSGALADRLGRKSTLLLSTLLCGCGGILIGISTSWLWLIFGFVLMNIGWSLYSGCSEAFAYDSLADHHITDKYDEVLSRSYLLGTITFALTSLFGGVLFLINFKLPHIAWGLFYFIGFVALFFSKEPKSFRSEKVIYSNNFRQHIREGIQILVHSKIKNVLLFIALVQSIYFMYSEGFLQPAMAVYFGLDSTMQSILFALISLLAGICTVLLPRIRRKMRDEISIVFLCFLFGMTFLLGYFSVFWYGALSLFMLSTLGNFALPLTSVFINTHAKSESRATALSTIAFVGKAPYAFMAVLMGVIIESYTVQPLMLTFGLLCIIPSTIFFLRSLNK